MGSEKECNLGLSDIYGRCLFQSGDRQDCGFPSTYVWKMANYGKAHVWGADVTLSMGIPLGSGFRADVSGSYTWQKAIDLTDPTSKSYKDQLPYTPEHNGNGSVILETPWVKLGYSVIGVGKDIISHRIFRKMKLKAMWSRR